MASNELFDTGIKVTGSFSAAGAFPVDGKYIVETIAERDDHVTQNRAYDGMQVYVKQDKKTYQYQMINGVGTWEDFPKASDAPTKTSQLENDSNFSTCTDVTQVSSYPEPGLYDAEGNQTMTWEEVQSYSDDNGALPEGDTLVISPEVYFGMNYEGQTSSINHVIIGDGTTEFSLIPMSWTSYEGKPLTLTIPTSVTSIDTTLEDYSQFTIYYLGTEEQWNAIEMTDKDYFDGLGLPVVFNHTLGDSYSQGTLQDNTGSDFYPKTKSTAVEMKDGRTVEEALQTMSELLGDVETILASI